jgi:murein L,D-transpeptidase YcbB/YkuD
LAHAVLYGSASALIGSSAASARTRLVAARIPEPALPPLTVPDTQELLRAALANPTAIPRHRNALVRTLERLDDMGMDLSQGRTILVNIAAAELIAYQDGTEVLRSRVIVGGSRTRTPQLATFVTTVRFHPPWYVPASIVAELRAADSTLAGFNQVGSRLIQPPGPNNPLGPLRIGLENSDGIFLHGTNRPGAFARSNRTLSHGCVRIERVRELAAWLLDETPAAINARLAINRTQEIHPLREARVALAYMTIWPDNNRQLVAHADAYGLDAPGARRAPFRQVYRSPSTAPEPVEATTPPPDDDPL